MKGYLGLGRSTGICTTSVGNGSNAEPTVLTILGAQENTRSRTGHGGLLLRTMVLLALLVWSSAPVRAGRPLAENIVFGSVWKGGRTVVSTNVVIEARRGDVGPVVARCRIGEDPGAGEFFFLHIQRETAPALSPAAVDAEDVLTLVVTAAGQPSFKTRVKMPAPGRCVRIDFGRAGREVAVSEVDQAPAHAYRPATARPGSMAADEKESAQRRQWAASVMRVVERRRASPRRVRSLGVGDSRTDSAS